MSRLQNYVAVFVALIVVFMVQAAPASTIQIQFSGLDIVYDGTAIKDAGTAAMSGPDALSTMTFSVDNVPAGPTLLTDIATAINIEPVVGIHASGGAVHTGPDSGTFNLLTPDIGLGLELDGVTVNYVPLGYVQFVFAGSLAEITGQDLPYDLTIGEPVVVSFSTQVNPGSITDDGEYLTGFTASGTGEVRGRLVPEPSTIVLLLIGLALACRWPRR